MFNRLAAGVICLTRVTWKLLQPRHIMESSNSPLPSHVLPSTTETESVPPFLKIYYNKVLRRESKPGHKTQVINIKLFCSVHQQQVLLEQMTPQFVDLRAIQSEQDHFQLPQVLVPESELLSPGEVLPVLLW